MSKVTYCTYFDCNYLIRGIVMIDSLRAQYSAKGLKLDLIVVCMDEITRLILEKLYGPELTLMPMHKFEEDDHELLAVKHTRSHVEYLWTTTPNHLLRAFALRPDADYVAYVDADLEFYSDPQVIFEELGDNNVLIHEHRFPARIAHLAVSGTYNVGIVAARRGAGTDAILNWWRERCLEWCGSTSQNGLLGDQGYLNDWPTRFPGVVVTKNIGVGVAPWNQEQYRFSKDNKGTPLVDGKPIVFYHYHAFALANPYLIIPAVHLDYVPGFSLQIIQELFLPYIQRLHGALLKAREVLPNFALGTTRDNLSVSPHHVVLSAAELEPELRKIGMTQKSVQLDQGWIALMPG